MLLKDYLKEKGLTQSEFGRLVGVSTYCISHYVLGKRRPILEVAVRIRDATNGMVKLEDLLMVPRHPKYYISKKKKTPPVDNN